MSELKAYYIPTRSGNSCHCYLKYEADKVIAELEMKLAAAQHVLRLNQPEALYSNLDTMGRLKHEIGVAERRERHQKYKRCMAMAEMCMHKRWRNDEGFDYARSHRHMKKWLELAEKFKEAK